MQGSPSSPFFYFFLIFFHVLPFLFLFLISFFFIFSFPFSFLLPFLFFSFPARLFGLLQVRGNFLSHYYSSFHVSHFQWSMCHMDTCSRWHSPHHMAFMPCVLLPWCHVAALGHAMWHHPMCHLTHVASKNVKFLPYRNSTKFD